METKDEGELAMAMTGSDRVQKQQKEQNLKRETLND